MKSPIQVCGSISKHEILSQIKTNILPDTFVAEASEPYADYYGGGPNEAKPNSIFMFTRKFYFLEEILSLQHELENCPLDKLNMATAIVYINEKQYPAIRLKFFPDYRQLAELQKCFVKQGIEFASPVGLNGKYRTDIHKLFNIEEDEPGIYMDLTEANKGYFIFPQKLAASAFYEIFDSIKNNSSCHLFDAEQGTIIMNGEVLQIVRIFAEGLDIHLLECIQQQFQKFFRVHKTIHSSYV